MKRFKKPFKFYVIMFLVLAIAVGGYSVYKIFVDNTPVKDVSSLWALPVIFIIIYYGSDTLIDKLFNKKQQINYESKFIEEIAKKMRESNEFLIEDYRRLQLNQKFQDSLKIAYQIFLNGENELFNIKKLERKFKDNTLEKKAMDFVINHIRETKKPVE